MTSSIEAIRAALARIPGDLVPREYVAVLLSGYEAEIACRVLAVEQADAAIRERDELRGDAERAKLGCSKFLQAINIFNDGPDESDEAMATRILSEAVQIARDIRDAARSTGGDGSLG